MTKFLFSVHVIYTIKYGWACSCGGLCFYASVEARAEYCLVFSLWVPVYHVVLIGFLTESEVHSFGEGAGCPWIFWFCPPMLRLQAYSAMLGILRECWGFELRSSCMDNKCFYSLIWFVTFQCRSGMAFCETVASVI